MVVSTTLRMVPEPSAGNNGTPAGQPHISFSYYEVQDIFGLTQ